MWTYINKEDFKSFLKQYPILSYEWDKFVLLQTKNEFFLPRLFYKNFPSQYVKQYEGKRNITPETFEGVKFKFDLRPKQKEAFAILLNEYKKNGKIQGIAKLPPGSGKTILSIALACHLKLKTCIFLNNSDLLKQWVKEIIQSTNLSEDDIGIVRQKLNVTDKPINIIMCQTMISKIKRDFKKTFIEFDDNGFGLAIFDEVHSTSNTEKYAGMSILLRSQNIIGLSATPFHRDSAKILMENTIGNILVDSHQYELIPRFYFYNYESGLQKYKFVLNKIGDYIGRKSYYNKITTKSQNYFKNIAFIAKKLRKDNHKIMIICMTKLQVRMISDYLESQGIQNRKYYGEEREIDKENDSILVVTYKFCGQGFDMPALSALIYACPLAGKKSLIQTIGRILRELEGKNNPVVVDLIDRSFGSFFTSEITQKSKILEKEFENKIEIKSINENDENITF